MKKGFGTNFYSIYKNEAELYDVFSSSEIFSRELTNRIKKLLVGDTLLDVACGTCNKTNLLSKYFKKVYALDTSISFLDYARRKYKNNKKFNFLLCSSVKIPLLDDSVDTIFISWGSFPLVKTLNEIKRVIRPGGVIIRIGVLGLDNFTKLFPSFDLKRIKRIEKKFELAGFKKEEHVVTLKFKNIKSAKMILSKILGIDKKLIVSNNLKHKIVLFIYKK